MTPDSPHPAALVFPCPFAIKAMGLADDDFEALVVALVRAHAGELADDVVSTRASAGGKYLSVTVTIEASSRAQLDAIYLALSRHERVLMVL